MIYKQRRTPCDEARSSMGDTREYGFQVMVSRPDLHEYLNDGAACVIRVALEVVGEDEFDTGSAFRSPGGSEVDEPDDELMLTIGVRFLSALIRSLLASAFVCRIEPSGAENPPWKWPLFCRTAIEVESTMESVLTEVGMLPDRRPYPLLIWAMPTDDEQDLNGMIKQFRDDHGSKRLWGRIMQGGAVRASVTESRCSIACDCDQIAGTIRQTEMALANSGVAAEWFHYCRGVGQRTE